MLLREPENFLQHGNKLQTYVVKISVTKICSKFDIAQSNVPAYILAQPYSIANLFCLTYSIAKGYRINAVKISRSERKEH